MGARDGVRDLLGDRWNTLLDVLFRHSQYTQLTVEFYSTFRVRFTRFSELDVVEFSLGHQIHRLSILEFAVHLGLYTTAEVSDPTFKTSLRGIVSLDFPTNMSVTMHTLRRFWASILFEHLYVLVIRPAASILTPSYCMYGRCCYDGIEKVNKLDLFILYCILTRKETNLATIILSVFDRAHRGSTSRLALGQVIAHMAEHLRVYQRYPTSTLSLATVTRFITYVELQSSDICPPDSPYRFSNVREPEYFIGPLLDGRSALVISITHYQLNMHPLIQTNLARFIRFLIAGYSLYLPPRIHHHLHPTPLPKCVMI